MIDRSEQRCGFMAVLGAPNVGKSTLVNRLVGTKVSIVSPKVQTTRTRVLGIRMEQSAQLVFIDTPGVFVPKRRLDRAMVASAWGGAADADRILLMIDATKGIDADSKMILDKLRAQDKTALLVINKIDLIDKQNLLDLTDRLSQSGSFSDIFMISAQTGDGVKDLLARLVESAPLGPWMYPEDQISDMPSRLLAAEITREKVFLQLHQELPYAVTVETEGWQEKEDGSVTISQIIYVEKPGQKGIVLGQGGSKIKTIGQSSRLELEQLFGHRVHVKLFVKVREKWGDDPERFRDWGLDFNA